MLQQVTEVFQDVFDDADLAISRETSATDVAGWDSVMHVQLILAIEKTFRVRFSSSEVASLHNVGELLDLLASKVQR